MLTLVLGIVTGLLCGITCTRRTLIYKQSTGSSALKCDLNISKGPLYEEVEIDKHVELSQNVSYDIVNKI